MKTLIAVVALLLTATGCGGKASAPIGAACKDSGDCASSSYCATNYPGGYCSMACTGRPSACPSGSLCARVSPDTAECYSTCSANSDCRSGYGCFSITGSSQAICLPL